MQFEFPVVENFQYYSLLKAFAVNRSHDFILKQRSEGDPKIKLFISFVMFSYDVKGTVSRLAFQARVSSACSRLLQFSYSIH